MESAQQYESIATNINIRVNQSSEQKNKLAETGSGCEDQESSIIDYEDNPGIYIYIYFILRKGTIIISNHIKRYRIIRSIQPTTPNIVI